VESAPAAELFRRPLHPYTRALLRSLPRIDRKLPRLESIPGMPPRLDRGPFSECSFAARCRHVHAECRRQDPPLVTVGPGRVRRCVLPVEPLD
jgi:oligopeptide/dipeptide ABC transporter ATP-binding protein